MSPSEKVVALAAAPVTAPAFRSAGFAETEAPIASASEPSEPANNNATSGPAMAAVGKKLGETVSRPSEAAAMDALAALAPNVATTSKSAGEAPEPAVAPAAPASNPFAPFPPFQPGQAPNPPPQTPQSAAQAGTPQWNAMMQYYAYYSYMLAHGGVAPGPSNSAQAAAPASAPPHAAASGALALAPKPAPGQTPLWGHAGQGPSPGMIPGMGMFPGMPVPGMGVNGMGVPGMGIVSPAQMHSMAQMAAAAAGMLPPPLISVGTAAARNFSGGPGLGKPHKRDRSHGDDDGTHAKRWKRKGLVDEIKTCVNCGCTRTPFWRKEPVGGGSLCNACGLYLAKNDAPRPKMLWRRGSGSGESTPEAADTPPPPAVEPSAGGSTTPPPPET